MDVRIDDLPAGVPVILAGAVVWVDQRLPADLRDVLVARLLCQQGCAEGVEG